jgi:hypothetical protein
VTVVYSAATSLAVIYVNGVALPLSAQPNTPYSPVDVASTVGYIGM